MEKRIAAALAFAGFVGGLLSLLELFDKVEDARRKPHANQKVTAHFPAEDTSTDTVL